MITFWVIGAILIGIALAFVLPPLLEKPNKKEKVGDQASQEANVAVYQDQLNELDRDLKHGIVSSEQHAQDREELERRLLEDVALAERSSSAPARSVSKAEGRRAAYVVAFALPILAIVLYLKVGNPKASPAGPPVTTQATTPTQQSTGEFSQERIEGNVANLAKRLEQNPNDVQGWTMLARSYASLQKYKEASEAYSKANALKPDDADLLADYAFALAMAQDRKLEGQPVELIQKALKLDPENAKALELAGSAAFEAKDYKRAIDYWEKLLKRVPADSELFQSLSERIEEAKTRASDR